MNEQNRTTTNLDSQLQKLNDVKLSDKEFKESFQIINKQLKTDKEKQNRSLRFSHWMVTLVTGFVLTVGIWFLLDLGPSFYQSDDEIDKQIISEVSLVDTLATNQQLRFRGLDWFASEQEVLEHEGIDRKEATILRDAIITNPKKITFPELNLTVETDYEFNKDPSQFVKGRYRANFDNQEEFITSVTRVEEAIVNKFGSPFAGNLGNLETLPSTGSGRSIQWTDEWRGNTSNSLTLNVFNNSGLDSSNPPYILTIEISVRMFFNHSDN